MTHEALTALLYRSWDPIGVRGSAPEDEYADTATLIMEVLASGASSNEIACCLASVRNVAMGLPSAPAEDERVAGLILAMAISS